MTHLPLATLPRGFCVPALLVGGALTLGTGFGCTAPSGPDGSSGSTSAGGAGAALGTGATGMGAGLSVDGSGATGGVIVGSPVDPCIAAACGPGQRCEVTDEVGMCVDLSCDELACGATEECRPHELGGHTCVNLLCEQDVDCDEADYCSEAGSCVSDVCEAGQSRCEGQEVTVCASNGGHEESPFACGSESNFESVCTESGTDAACGCEDDWDCPAFTVCEVSRCVGTGQAPSCTLPPTDFAETEPAVESHWGNDAAGMPAHDGAGNVPPWPESSEVQATPTVANLDDDNGDGLINELDIPEIIFVSYTSGSVDNSGILRAIHGGGPDRGKDYFAVCSSTVWQEGDPLPAGTCPGDGRSRSPAAIGDLNEDGVPEIVQVTMNDGLRVLSSTGEILINLPNDSAVDDNGISISPTIANLDHAGLPEVILGGRVYILDTDETGQLFVSHRYDIPNGGTGGANGTGGNRGGPMTCVADLAASPGQEIVAGPTLYRLPETIPACAAPPCAGILQAVWTGSAVNTGGNALLANEGLCAVADIWGADATARPGPANPPDGQAEVILIANGNVIILEGETGQLIFQAALGGAERGGAPNVDDFDGDGFLEIATALSDFYDVIDLQDPEPTNCPAWPTVLPRAFLDDQADNPNTLRTPGDVSCTQDSDCNPGAVCNSSLSACVCLHNGWRRESDDDSSKLTSSSVFDFNGDGAAEVIYNDECEFRIFDGVTGGVHFAAISRGRTWTENPIVADVDSDGNAEVVTFANTEPGDRCEEDGQNPIGPNGIRVWGDPQDTWVPARRIWNQQSYHVTNVTEGGRIPVTPASSWKSYAGRSYNTYRSQPRTFGVAPDLTVTGVGLFSPNAQCGDLSDVINITYEVTNSGDLRVGPGVTLAFFGTWAGVEEPLLAAGGEPLLAALADGIEPNRSVIETVRFELAHQVGRASLPEQIRVEADFVSGSAFGGERECREDNNSGTVAVEGGKQLADLRVAVGGATVDCGSLVATVAVKVENYGVVTANQAVIQLFAGNPAQGGQLLTQHVLDAPLGPGQSAELSLQVPGFPENRDVTLWAFVDPANAIEECNEADNTDPADNSILCQAVVVR